MGLVHVFLASSTVSDPEVLLAAAVLAVAVEDLSRKEFAADARYFLDSYWGSLFLTRLNADREDLANGLERMRKQKMFPESRQPLRRTRRRLYGRRLNYVAKY